MRISTTLVEIVFAYSLEAYNRQQTIVYMFTLLAVKSGVASYVALLDKNSIHLNFETRSVLGKVVTCHD
jgi:hypothetical protein